MSRLHPTVPNASRCLTAMKETHVCRWAELLYYILYSLAASAETTAGTLYCFYCDKPSIAAVCECILLPVMYMSTFRRLV